MNGFSLHWLREPRLKALALGPWPVWLWSADASRVLWANPTGAAIFGAPSPAALATRIFDSGQPAAAQVANLAATLPADGTVRHENLRGFGAGIGRILTCACSSLKLQGGATAVLIAAAEPAGPELLLSERVTRLLDGCAEPIAAFTADGALLHATPAARAHLGNDTSLASLGAEALAAAARHHGHAISDDFDRPIMIDSIGDDSKPVLIVEFGASDDDDVSVRCVVAAPAVESAPADEELPPFRATAAAVLGTTAADLAAELPGLAVEQRHRPLRFVWRMDAESHFTIDSPDFVATIGPRNAALLGQRWDSIVTAADLDPAGDVARAIARRDTWSGLTVWWPIEGSRKRLAAELSGLPIFDRERAFRGYRGFGVCRDIALLNALANEGGAGTAASSTKASEALANTTPDVQSHTVTLHLPDETDAPVLSPRERKAFHELSRRLADHINVAGAQIEDIAASTEPPSRHGELAAARPEPDPIDAELAQARAQNAELTAILDTATDGVIVIDRAARIVSANRSAQALFGYEAHEFEGKIFNDLFAPDSLTTAIDYLDRLQASGVASLLNDGRDIVGRERNGGHIPLFMTIGPLGDGGKFCAVFRDVTAWKKAEQELTAAKHEAERASAAKSDFLARISHEIRTPLNAIIGFSEVMMEERLGPVGNERYRQYLKDIHASGGHLLSLINDLLDLSKIEAGKLDLNLTDVPINDLAQQCVAIMQPQASRERIIIRTSLSARLPQVTADARSVRQMVLNLLSNSIKFTGAGGQVIVSTAVTDQGDVALRVRDTGIGMSEKDIATAMEPFRQVAMSAKARAGGTGLGLPLTKALAEANRAGFHIKSTPNSGTLVEITFPPARVLAG